MILAPAPTEVPAAAATRGEPGRTVDVRAPGRLHLGFLDPAGTLGRPFGSLGLVIEGFETRITLRAARAGAVTAAPGGAQREIERAAVHLATLQSRSGRREALHLHLAEALPAHAGFGSGTQLALAVGRAFAQWHGLALGTAQIAHWLGRGRRSGVGIAGFDQGGLLLDGGPGRDGLPAPLLSRLPLPEAWRVVLVLDHRDHGLSGDAEIHAIDTLAPLARSEAADICHQVLMRVLPGAANADFAAFAQGVTHIQRLLGRHFAPAQRGSAYASAAVGRAVEAIGAAVPMAALGQSSWGPTGFAILPTEADAMAALEAAHRGGQIDAALEIRMVRARNHGMELNDRTGSSSPG